MKTKILTLLSLLFILSAGVLAQNNDWQTAKSNMYKDADGSKYNTYLVDRYVEVLDVTKTQEKEIIKAMKEYNKTLKEISKSTKKVKEDFVDIKQAKLDYDESLVSILTDEQNEKWKEYCEMKASSISKNDQE